jgi:hypothetical protein
MDPQADEWFKTGETDGWMDEWQVHERVNAQMDGGRE